MGLNEKQKEEEACRRLEMSTRDLDHRTDIPGSRDATTSDVIAADLRSQQAQLIHDTTRHANWFPIEGKSLEPWQLELEEDGQALRSNSAFKRVQNRLWIKQNTVLNELLQDGEHNLKLITEHADRQEKRLEDLRNQVFNLVGFFSVFQGVILMAVTQLSSSLTTQIGAQQGQARPLCGKVWVPVILSVLAGFVTIVSVSLKIKHLYGVNEFLNELKYDEKVRGFSHATYIQSFVVAVSS